MVCKTDSQSGRKLSTVQEHSCYNMQNRSSTQTALGECVMTEGNIQDKRPIWPQVAHLKDHEDLTLLPTFYPAPTVIELDLDIKNINILTKL